MKKLITFIMVATCLQASAQEVAKTEKKRTAPLQLKGAVTATVAVSFIDYFRHSNSLSWGYKEGNTTGFAPLYARVEYGLTEQLGIAATFGYETFVHNYDLVYGGSYGTRHRTDKVKVLSGGIAGIYHFRPLSFVPRLYPFIGVGIGMNNLRYDNYQQGQSDSLISYNRHGLAPVLKVGARYYISDHFSIYADGGSDNLGVFSIGASYTLFPRKCKTDKK